MLNVEDIYSESIAFETPRLLLRRLVAEDKNDIFEYASNPEVSKLLSWTCHESLSDSQEYLDIVFDKYENQEVSEWGVILKSTNTLIGTAGYLWWLPEHGCAELGYAIGQPYWNKGYTTEITKKMIEFGFDILQLNRIEARCIPQNIASEKVLLKSGMQHEGTMRKQVFFKGKHHDMKVFSILKSEYKLKVHVQKQKQNNLVQHYFNRF